MNERISAFLDGELDARERDRLMREMGQNPASRAAWERYHMIGAALRKDIHVVASADLAERVLYRIEKDPLPFARIARRPLRHFTKLAGGLALAASVAAVAVFSFKSVLLPDTTHIAVSAPATDATLESKTQTAKAAQDSSLNALLVRHNEFSLASSINGMMPYVRVVSHSNDQ
jgi:sigma-E factor negative regulatory protein RseA